MNEPVPAQVTSSPIPTFFIDPLARIIMGFFLFIAFLVGRPDLAIFCLVVLLLSSGAKLWRRAGAAQVTCRFRSDTLRAFPGEPLGFAVDVVNGSFLPMEIRSRLGGADRLSTVKGTEDARVCKVGARRSARLAWDLKAPGRGVYRIGPPVTEAGDVFGLFFQQTSREEPLDLVVYPRLFPVTPLPWQARELFGSLRAKGLIEDPVHLMGTREYQPGRPARAIHWKASVRLNRLQEKVFEPSKRAKIVLSLDVRGFHSAGDADAFEAAVEAVASVGVRLIQDGVAVGLVTNAECSGNQTPLVPVALRPGHVSVLLERMARLTMEPAADLIHVTRHLLDRTTGVGCVHFAFTEDEDLDGYASYLQGRRIPASFMVARRAQREGARTFSPGVVHSLDVLRGREGGAP